MKSFAFLLIFSVAISSWALADERNYPLQGKQYQQQDQATPTTNYTYRETTPIQQDSISNAGQQQESTTLHSYAPQEEQSDEKVEEKTKKKETKLKGVFAVIKEWDKKFEENFW